MLGLTFALSLSLRRRHWNGPKLGKGGWIRDLKALMEDGDRFLEGGFSPNNRFPAVRYNAYAIDRSRSKDSENIHRCFNELGIRSSTSHKTTLLISMSLKL